MSALQNAASSNTINERPRPATGLVWGAMLLALVLWASAFPGIRAGLRDLAPLDLVTLRLTGAAALMAVYAAATRMRLPERRDWPRIALAGLLGMALYQVSLSMGETRVPAGAASLLSNTGPVFGAILACVVLKERVSLLGWAGIAASFAGATLVALSQDGGGNGGGVHGLHFSLPALLVIASALCGTLYSVLQKPMLARYTAVEFTAYAIWVGALCLAPNLPHLVAIAPRVPHRAWAVGLYLAAVPTIIAFALWSYALAHQPYSRIVSLFYLLPVLVLVISYFWLGEVPREQSLIGGAVILAGVILVNTYGRANSASAPEKEKSESV